MPTAAVIVEPVMESSLKSFVEKLCSQTVLAPDEREAIMSLRGHAEQLQPGKTFVSSGDQLTSACLVIDGYCGRVEVADDDRRPITALYLRGEMPDLYGAYTPQACSTLEALTSAAIVRIPHVAIHSLMAAYPAIAEAFSRHLLSDATLTEEWLVNVGSRSALSRIAHFICETAVRLHVVEGNAFSFALPLTQNQLSRIAGLSTVHVNRSLKSLRRLGLMMVEHGRIQVLDWIGLKTAADFDDGYLQTGIARRFCATESTVGKRANWPA